MDCSCKCSTEPKKSPCKLSSIPIEQHPKLISSTTEFDYIIVGAGSSGSIIAKEISDDFYNHVLVVEQGQYLISSPEIIDTTNIQDSLRSPDLYLGYISQPYDGLRNPFYVGRTTGGSSAHNYLIASRPSPDYHKRLGLLVGSGWSYANALPIYKQLEDYTGKITSNRAIGGPIGIYQYPAGNSPFITYLPPLLASSSAGDGSTPVELDYNNGYNDVIGTAIQRFQYRDKTLSFTGRGFLGPDVIDANGMGVGNRNLRLITNTYVNRVIFDNNRKAIGIECTINGVSINFMTRKKVIICAGALSSPLILIRSGIGPINVLNSLNIRPVVENPYVGTKLLNMYGPVMIVETSKSQLVSQNTSEYPTIVSFLRFIPTSPIDSRNISIVITTQIPDTNNVPANIRKMLHLETPLSPDRVLLYVLIRILNPLSHGSVSPSNVETHSQPDIKLNYYSSVSDLNLARQGLTYMKEVFSKMNTVIGSYEYLVRFPPINSFTNNLSDLDPFIINGSSYTNYYAGSIPMSKGQESGVVDSNLYVYNTDNLMVADLSVVPIYPDADTGLISMYIGKRASQILGYKL